MPIITWSDEDGHGVPMAATPLQNGSPTAEETPSRSEYMECECGETIALSDFDNHRDLHLAENIEGDELDIASSDSDTTIESSANPPYKSHHISQPHHHRPASIRPTRSNNRDMTPVGLSGRARNIISPEPETLDSLSALTISRKEKAGSHSISESSPKAKATKPRPSTKSWIDAFTSTDLSKKRSRSGAGKPGEGGLRRLGVSATLTGW